MQFIQGGLYLILWKDILKPIPVKLKSTATISEALNALKKAKSEIGFVYDNDKVMGYVSRQSIMEQLADSSSLEEEIKVQKDVLKVRHDTAIEFYLNCSLYLVMNDDFEGYITQSEAIYKMMEQRFLQLNKSIDSAEIGIITMDRKFNVTFMNETAENIIGLPRTVLLERNYRQMIRMDEDLSLVLKGSQLMNVRTSFNFKAMNGHLSPIYEKGKVTGIVHIFHLQKQFEESAKDLEFVRELNEDLKAIYSASDEQILVVNRSGTIKRLAGTFLEQFWGDKTEKQVLQSTISDLEKEGAFQPNIFEQCLNEKKKLSIVQETSAGNRIWSTATPVFNGENIKKIIIISRDITSSSKENSQDSHKEDSDHNHPEKKLIYKSKAISDLVNEMKQIAEVDSTVLLFGESGAGKEVFAQFIHKNSKRKDQPIVSMNCGAIPENLLESELFGYEKGAFTGAVSSKKGLFELANNGTLFLDEITELPLHMQVKLLRALQEMEIVRVGGIKTISINVRVIATTNRDIQKMVKENKFREDLYYRINVIPIHIPPLRERKEDIVSLSLHFLERINRSYGKEKSLSREALLLLESYRWPGNVRELQNVIERLAVTTKEPTITQEDVLRILYSRGEAEQDSHVFVSDVLPLKNAVKELEGQLIKLAMQKYGTAAEAAKALNISPATISRRLNSLLK
jgi:transcriptional regulator with PAS, ATPase and Fis domain